MGKESSSSSSRNQRNYRRDREYDRNVRKRSPRHRSRSPRDRKHRRSPDRTKDRKDKRKEPLDLGEIVRMTDKEEAEQRLEDEMQKRREKIEKWREERKLKLQAEELNKRYAEQDEQDQKPVKQWTLDDEADDDEEEDMTSSPSQPMDQSETKDVNLSNDTATTSQNGTETAIKVEDTKETVKIEKVEPKVEPDDDDPLDAFMADVNNEVRQLRGQPTLENEKKIVMVTKVIADEKDKGKGDIVEQNADALEYSDEEKDFDVDSAMVSLTSKARQLPMTDHEKVYYRPFRKDFYVEVPELARMTPEEVEKYRLDMEGIKVRGKRCPKPLKSWAQCGCSRAVLELLKRFNYEKPTPIQAQAIPAIMSGRDVMGIAKTGSGKTLAFVIPMLRHVMDQPPLEEMDGPTALIISPTRELAIQTAKECKKFAKVSGANAVCVYGGTGISEQIAELKRGAEIVICTPGRLIDMLAANNGRVTNLRRITYLVLDEADRMFDMGFEPQITRIVGNIRPDKQTVLFSATFPRQMEALARKVLIKPVEILVGARSVVCKDIEQHVVICEEHQKFLKLLELLGVYWEHGNVLVFVDKQEHADELVSDLMSSGYNCAPLHGGIDQFDRDSTILDFKSAKIKLMVATSVAARGLDVKKLILVVNYDCPNHYEDYVHRVGRTGRAGNKGYAYTFLLPEGQERYAGDLVKALELAEQDVPEDLNKLWLEFKAKMAEEGKEIKQGGGFGGHGYRFDEAEAEEVTSKKKMERLVHGLENDDDDDEIEQQITSMMKSTKRVLEGVRRPKDLSAPNQEALERAKELAKKLQFDKNLGAVIKDSTQQTAEALMKGESVGPANISAKSVAQSLAGKLNERLNYIPSERELEAEAPEQSYFEEELDINDFPQQETLSMIQEYADVGISVKGQYVPPNKKSAEDIDRRLHLCIESTAEISLNRAKAEIVRVLKESFMNLAAQGQRDQGPRGRYKVV